MGIGTDVFITLIQNPRSILIIFSMLSSLFGFSSWNWYESNNRVIASNKVVKIYSNVAAKQHDKIIKHTTTNTTTIIKSDCNKCDKLETEINKLKEWHQ